MSRDMFNDGGGGGGNLNAGGGGDPSEIDPIKAKRDVENKLNMQQKLMQQRANALNKNRTQNYGGIGISQGLVLILLILFGLNYWVDILTTSLLIIKDIPSFIYSSSGTIKRSLQLSTKLSTNKSYAPTTT